MSGRNRSNEPEWPIGPDQPATREAPVTRTGPADEPRGRVRATRQVNPVLLALGGLILLLLLLWLFTATRNSDQDKLTSNALASAIVPDHEKLCATQSTYDLIKRELFRRAAQLRGSDQATFDKLSGYSALRMENPVMESEDKGSGAVNCSGSLSLDLPPGVAVVGGRRTLTSDVDYTVQPAADGSGNVVLLRNVDAIVTPLATLARVTAPAPAPAPAQVPPAVLDNGQAAAPEQPPQAQPVQQAAPQAQPAPRAQESTARPSFPCANARTRGEISVCHDAGLAALDRSMAAQYGRAAAQASPDQRALLQQTRNRFLVYRDRCPNEQCIADAYRGRMREIGDIMAGRWSPR